MAVVLPHRVVGDRAERAPERQRFGGFGGLSRDAARAEDVDVERVAVDELEAEGALFDEAERVCPHLLLELPPGRGERGLAGFEAAAGAVDLPRAEAAPLLDEEDLAVADREDERRPLRREPGLPVDVAEGAHAGQG